MDYLIQESDIIQTIERYSHAQIIWLDTEVADYQTKNPRLSLIQLLDDPTDLTGDRVIILDVLDRPDLINYFITKIMINSDLEKVIHQASYDCQLLGKRKVKNVTCTLKLAQSLPYYLAPLPNLQLKTLAEKLCSFPPINKQEQGSDWGQRPLTDRQVQYATMDVVYLAQVYHRLLQLSQLVNPNPEVEDIAALTLRYRQIEKRWKELDTEIEHLKERLKKAMASQKVEDFRGFTITQQTRNSKKLNLNELSKIVQHSGKALDISIKLTQDLQKKLTEVLGELPLEEETETISQLRINELDFDEEDLPF